MDHLVFAAPDLDVGVRAIEESFGISTSPGGQHLGVGTCNRLIGFGADQYMEIVSVDPDQPPPDRPRWFGLDTLLEPRLATWCVQSCDLEGLVERGLAAGIDLGVTSVGGRERPDGSTLSWTVTDPWADRASGVIPFFIDWGDTAHPGAGLSASCSFLDLRVEHPEAEEVARWMRVLGLDVPVVEGEAPRVIATIETPRGVVEVS